MMKRAMIQMWSLLMAVMVLCCFADGEYAKKQRPLFDYILEPVNVRAVALGGTGTASAHGGFSFYNPAAAAAVKPFVAVDFGEQWGDLVRGSVETAWIFEKWYAGLSFFSRSIEFPLADIHGEIGGSGAVQESMLSLLGGWKNDRVAIAVAATGLPYSMYDRTSFALTSSGGITVKALSDHLTLGAAVLNAGRYYRGFYNSTFASHRDSMATTMRAGATWTHSLFGGLPVQASADVVYEEHTGAVLVPFGIETTIKEVLSVRIGKRIGHTTDVMTFGVGLAFENCSFDASFVPVSIEGDADMKWLMGLRYELPSFKKREEKRTPVIADTARVTPLAEPVAVPPQVVPAEVPVVPVEAPAARLDTVSETSPAAAPADSMAKSIESKTAPVQAADTAALPQAVLPVHGQDSLVTVPDSTAGQDATGAPLPSVKEADVPKPDTLRQP